MFMNPWEDQTSGGESLRDLQRASAVDRGGRLDWMAAEAAFRSSIDAGLSERSVAVPGRSGADGLPDRPGCLPGRRSGTGARGCARRGLRAIAGWLLGFARRVAWVVGGGPIPADGRGGVKPGTQPSTAEDRA